LKKLLKLFNFISLQKSLESKWHFKKSFLKYRQECTMPLKEASDELTGDLQKRIPYRKVLNIKKYIPWSFSKTNNMKNK